MRHRLFIVLAVSGVLGFRAGMVAFPDWQTAVETAQVTAGIVKYPSSTPFFIYHVKLWTILHQVLAVFLRAGISEIRLSLVLSGLLGMVAFQGLSMFVFALADDVLLAVVAPLVVLIGRITYGVAYPIFLVGSVHTYGMIGLSLFVLVVGLLGAGAYRTGAFLFGLTPAVHPSIGLWLWVVVALSAAWDLRRTREALAPALGYLVAGCIVTAVSLAVQLTSAFPVERIAPAEASHYLAAFVNLWDVHRQPVSLRLGAVVLNEGALLIALAWLLVFRASLSQSATFLLRIVVVAAGLSLAFIPLSWLPPEQLPPTLLILMPTRLGNFGALVFAPLLLGLIGASERKLWGSLLAVIVAGALVLNPQGSLWTWWPKPNPGAGAPPWATWFDLRLVLEVAAAMLAVLALASWRRQRANLAGRDRHDREGRVTRWVTITARGALLALTVWLTLIVWRLDQPRALLADDYVTNPVFKEASKGTGLLLTGGNLHLIQLRTRRPILLDGGGLDSLPYAVDSGPEMARILREVYEVDFFNPPEEARRQGAVPSQHNQTAWERFTLEKWRQIRYSYQVRQVMTDAFWYLQLPLVAQDANYRLYQIPD